MSVPGCLSAVALILLGLTGNAEAQYMFLDANGDGVHDASDQLDPSGTTTIDLWIDTASNRDGSPAVCDTDAATRLSINSWEVVLRAVGGTLEWGPAENLLTISPARVCFATDADTTDPVWYHNGWGGHYILDPGRYHLARLRIRVLTGDPGILIMPFNPSQPTDLTSFGTQCGGIDEDNTYKLGSDWRDADGIRAPVVADAGGAYLGSPSVPIRFDGSASLNDPGYPVLYTWEFGDGARGEGTVTTHAYAEVGEYTVTLTVDDGRTSHTTWTTARIVPRSPPIARAGGPYTGFVGFRVLFDGRGSSDANGDRLAYHWSFGDNTAGEGEYAFHTYYVAGDYTVTLSVSDGFFHVTGVTTAHIDGRAQHPPIAVAGGPYEGHAGLAMQLNGRSSYDPDGDALTYRWTLGDGGTSTDAAPVHAYAAAGEYEVILEVSDGTLMNSDVTSASVRPTSGGPPVANAGGPYRALPQQPVQFDGRASSDPDGDALGYRWNFGDAMFGDGPTPVHSYRGPGQYRVTLSVSDGAFAATANTTTHVVSESDWRAARAFVRGAGGGIALAAMGGVVHVQLEPVDGTFRIEDLDLSRAGLACAGSGARNGIRAHLPIALGGDQDGNGVREATAAFLPEDVRRLLGHIDRPTTATIEFEGALTTGAPIRATISLEITPARGRFPAVVSPNPFNPQATLSFVTTKPGRVSAHLFNLTGRLVKTVLDDVPMSAGPHQLAIDARGDGGSTLSSGIYFLRVLGPDGATTTRIAVAK